LYFFTAISAICRQRFAIVKVTSVYRLKSFNKASVKRAEPLDTTNIEL
jgi:hypothetical protein